MVERLASKIVVSPTARLPDGRFTSLHGQATILPVGVEPDDLGRAVVHALGTSNGASPGEPDDDAEQRLAAELGYRSPDHRRRAIRAYAWVTGSDEVTVTRLARERGDWIAWTDRQTRAEPTAEAIGEAVAHAIRYPGP